MLQLKMNKSIKSFFFFFLSYFLADYEWSAKIYLKTFKFVLSY